MDPAIQIVINARLTSVKDQYMDSGAVQKLEYDLLHETGAERVETDIVDDVLTAKVWVLGVEYTADVELSQTVPTVHQTYVPAHMESVTTGISDGDKDAMMKEHMEQQKEETEKVNAEHRKDAQAKADAAKNDKDA